MNKNYLIKKCKDFYLRTSSVLSSEEKDLLKKEFEYFLSQSLIDDELLVYQIFAAFFLSIERFDEIISQIRANGFLNRASYHLIIIIGYFEDIILGGIQDDTYERLNALLEIRNDRQSVIELVKGWYFQKTMKNEKYRNALEKAYEFDSSIPQILIELGIYYIDNNELEMGKKIIKSGLIKIKNIIDDNQNVMRELDPDFFIDSFIKVFYVHQSFYDYITRMTK